MRSRACQRVCSPRLRKALNLQRAEYGIGLVVHLESPNLYQNEQRVPLTISKMMVDGEIERYWPRFMAEPGGISQLAIFDSTRYRLMPLHQLDTCLTGLRQQGISVSEETVGENGSTFEVMGFRLTAEQIVELHQQGQMDANGINAFAKSIKQDF
jgi:hypothetical protein